MKLADRIADYLFTNGAGKKARRLVFEMEDGSNGGGWGREPLRDAIADRLEEFENSFHRLCSAVTGGASGETLRGYAEQGLELIRGAGEIKNPFEYTAYGDRKVQAIDADSRLRMLKGFNAEQLRAVVELPGVQKTVRQAAERRLKKLGGEAGK